MNTNSSFYHQQMLRNCLNIYKDKYNIKKIAFKNMANIYIVYVTILALDTYVCVQENEEY